jgi:surfactin synthase thioesterase subunit
MCCDPLRSIDSDFRRGGTVTDWAEQSAETVAHYQKAHELPANVVVLGWSMAGRIAVALSEALRRRGVGLELFVAMAATPGLPNLLPGFSALAPDARGLAKVEDAFLDGLLAA